MVEDQLQEHQAHALKEYNDQGEYGKEEMDVLDLPPRKEVHQHKSRKTNWKFSKIWLRFLLLLFIILVSLLLSYNYWDEWFEDSDTVPAPNKQGDSLHEKVTVESPFTK